MGNTGSLSSASNQKCCFTRAVKCCFFEGLWFMSLELKCWIVWIVCVFSFGFFFTSV